MPVPVSATVHLVLTQSACTVTQPIQTNVPPVTLEHIFSEIPVNLVSSPVLPAPQELTPAAPPAHRDTSSMPTILPVLSYPPTHPTVERIAEPAVMLVETPLVSIVLPDSS
jgi:hypothetical protein